ncbi:hypothetical protein CAPTEDRAFT_54831, partial [Capitella teleta]
TAPVPSSAMSHLFTGSTHSHLYRLFRPNYPPELFLKIIDYCRDSKTQFQTCVDLGCGSGQSTFPLAPHFDQVFGVDVSESQIKEATKNTELTPARNVSFRVGSADDLTFLEPHSVDLITVAQTIHWLDTRIFYAQCKQVLKPRGVLAVYGYGNVYLDNPVANSVISKFYRETLWDRGYWDDRRRHIDNSLADFSPLPFRGFTRSVDDSLSMEKDMTLKDLVGYISTWSAY